MSLELDLRTAEREVFRRENAFFVPRDTKLPPICIRCGETSTESVSRLFSWHKPGFYWLILLGVLVYVIAAVFVRKSAKIGVPLCAVHFGKRKRLRNTAALVLILSPVVGIQSGAYLTDPVSIWGIVLALLMGLAGIIPFLTSTWSMLRPRYIDEEWAKFEGASESFLAHLSDAQTQNQTGVAASVPARSDKGWVWPIVFIVLGIGSWVLGDKPGDDYNAFFVIVGWLFLVLAVGARKSDAFAGWLPYGTKNSARRPDFGKVYRVGAWITGTLAFLISWIYAVVSYGFFLGVGLGWIPSLVIAVVTGLLWPVVAVVGLAVLIFILYAVNKP